MSLATITSGAQLADVTVAQLFAARLAERPSKTAYHQKRHGAWTAVTWDTYAQRVVNLASALQRAGLQRGDRVAIMGDSSQEWLIADMAIMCAGGVMVGVYFTSSPEEVAYCFSDSGAKFAFVGGEQQLRVVLASGQAERLSGIIVLDPKWKRDPAASAKSLADFVGAEKVESRHISAEGDRSGQDERSRQHRIYVRDDRESEGCDADASVHSCWCSLRHHVLDPACARTSIAWWCICRCRTLWRARRRRRCRSLPMSFLISGRRQRTSLKRSKR
jgi:hypothetical protein